MKAIRIHEFGPTEDVLRFDEVPVPDRKVPVFKPSNEFKNLIVKQPL